MDNARDTARARAHAANPCSRRGPTGHEAAGAPETLESDLCDKLRGAIRQRLRAEEFFLMALERVADELPDTNLKLIEAVAQRLPKLATALDRDSILLHLLRQDFEARQERLERQIQRLNLEEKADCSAILELAEAMEPLLEGDGVRDVGAFAYLLRGVLETRRRHLVWADDVIGQELPTLADQDGALRRAVAANEEIASELQLLFSAA